MLRNLIRSLAGRRSGADLERLLEAAGDACDRGDANEAETLARAAIDCAPTDPRTHEALARALRARGAPQDAAQALLAALERDPDNLSARNELAVTLLALGRADEALQLLRWILKRAPDLPAVHTNLGIACERLGRFDDALAGFERAVALEPARAGARQNLALFLRRIDRHEAAEAALRRAHALAPDDVTIVRDLAGVVRELGRPAEARALLEPQLDRHPESADLRVGVAAALRDLGDFPGAAAQYEAALARAPAHGLARLGRGLLRLASADFASGWDDYESRFETEESPRRGFPFADWDGGSFAGRTVLVYAEQGLGDEIMFAGCLPDLVAEARRVVVECDPRLAGLFARSFPTATVFGAPRDDVSGWLDRAGPIDVQVPAGSLPRRYRRAADGFPDHAGYLRPDPERVRDYRARLAGLGPGRKIGLAWRGGLMRTRRAVRSIEPEGLAPLLTRADVHFVSLQHGDVEEDLARMRAASGRSPVHWPGVAAEPEEAGALMAALDASVAVCSAAVHLGGALGVRLLAMVPAHPEWRYLEAGDRLPWYPSVEVVRQAQPGDWGPVVEQVAVRL
jgi:Flp pilus assembly protein TadD